MGLLQDIYNKAKSALTDNEGWFRQGKFTPVTQMTGRPLVSQQPMLSPIARTPQEESAINWNTPDNQPAVIASPKPSFKTQAAEKLNSRLDQIKRFGSSVVSNAMDDKGFVRQGQLRPFAPIDDAIKATPVVQTVQKAIQKRVQGVKDFGTGIGKSVTTNWDADRIMQDQKAEAERTAKTFETVRKLRAMGKNDEADFLVNSVYEQGKDSDINRRIDELNNEINGGKKKLISGAIKTAEIPLTMYAGAPKAIANMTIGSILSGGISKMSGETPEQQIEASATGMDDAFGYTGITSLITNPIIEKVLGASKVKNILINQILQRTMGGLGNVGEDKLLASLDDKQYGGNDALSSFLVGGAITGNEGIAKGGKKLIDKYVFGKIPEPVKEGAQKFFGNQYKKVANTYNKSIDKLMGKPEVEKVGGGTFTPTKWIKDAEGNDKLVKINPQNGQVLMGGFAGLETYQDENGQWQVKFNPQNAAMGMMVAGGIKTKVGKQVLEKVKLPEIKAPDGVSNFKPAGWKPPETTKSISDIFANRKAPIGGDGYKVKGTPVAFEKMMAEGWKPEQIDYAVKLANDAKVTPKNAEAYVRAILKRQYPNQASKMGRQIPLPPEPPASDLARMDRNAGNFTPKVEDPELKMERLAGASKTQADVRSPETALADMESKMKQLEEAGYTPNPNIKPEAKPVVEAPKKKTVKDILTGSELEKQNQAKKAELDYADKKRKEIVAMMQKEGFDTKTSTAERIMSGELPASPELKSALQQHSKALGGETVKYKNLPEDKLKENYVPHVKKTSITPVDTESDGFVGMMNRNTFDPTKKRNNLIKDEDMANVDEAFRQEHISVLNEKYYASEQANKIIKENNLPPEKGDEVLKFIEKEKEIADKVAKEHIEATDFGVKHDYLADAKRHDEELSAITGTKVERPVVEATHKSRVINTIDNLQSEIRGDAMFFKAKTNKEINDAFIEFRLSQTGETKQRYDVALNKFISKLTKYDYADPAVRDRVNQFIDDKLKENRILEKEGVDKFIRGTTEMFSMAQIGGNIKTVITQPTETFRIIPEHGIKSFLKGVWGATTNKAETKRLMTDYGLEKEISGNLAQNPLYKEINDDPALKDKVYDSFKNFLFKGLEVTENWKNVAYASALEDAGKKKGLNGEPLKKFVMQEMLRLAHMADTDMTPRIMKNNAKASALLQYSQYLLKNEVLKWDTITSKDLKSSEKIKKVTALFLADLASVGTIYGITGVVPNGIKDWFANSALPTSLGPILTVPYQMAKDAYDFAQLTPEEQEKQTSLMDREKATIFRNFVPMGNQISKTKNALEVMDKGYAESKKGNVNYAVGEMNPIQKAQATIFGQGAIPAKKEADKRWNNLKEDGIYPTLTAEQSATLKDLPKDEQKAYYDSKMENQKSAKDIIKDEEKKPNLISSIFGKKETKEKQSISSILTSETATNQEKTKAKSIIKEKLDSGNTESINDDDLKTYFFNEVDKLPESTASEKQAKTIAKFKKLDSIYDSETLDQDTKDRLIKLSGVSKEDVTYYNNAKDDATVKAMRQEELAGQISRDEWMSQLEDGRKLVGNEQIVDNDTLNELYERNLLSDAERDYLIAVKYDPATSEFYVDRDYKAKQAGASASAKKKQATALKNLKKELESGSDKPRTMSRKAIIEYLNKKPTKSKSTTKTIGSILSGGKSVTPTSASVGKVNNRVKSKSIYSK